MSSRATTASIHARVVPLAAALVLATLYRVPALLNAGAVNSDAAVVGLQARHILHGEWAWRLWGTDYQGSVDALLAALSFALFGPTPLALFLVPFVGLLLMIVVAFDLLVRDGELAPWAAAAAVMPLVFAPMASNLPMVYVMRQTLATTVLAGVWLAHRRGRIGVVGPLLALALGLYVDLFAFLVFPGAAVLALLSRKSVDDVVDLARRRKRAFGAALGAGAIAVLVAVFAVPELRIRFVHNGALLFGTCLPFALGTTVFVKGRALVAEPWPAPALVRALQVAGGAVLVLSVLSAGPALFVRGVPESRKRLAAFGFVTTLATVGGFFVSSKPVDMWSCRYLAPIFWTAPLSLAPLVGWLGARRFALLEAPAWATALLGGWLSYGPFVDGPLPRRDERAIGADEAAVRTELLARGIHAAEAQYWLAYRLTLLFREDPIVVPLERGEDRHPPYRAAVDAAPRRALLFHPSEPRALPGPVEAELAARGVPYERAQVGDFTVLFVGRAR